MNAYHDGRDDDDSSDNGGNVSSDDEQERFGRRNVTRQRYTTVDAEDDDDDGQPYRKRSREEAIYGVFAENSSDDEDRNSTGRRQHRGGGRKRHKPLFPNSRSAASSATAPFFVKGDVLQGEEEQAAANNQEVTTTDTEGATSMSPNDATTTAQDELESPPPSAEELERQQQRQAANQQFLDLLNRAKRQKSSSRTRPRMASEYDNVAANNTVKEEDSSVTPPESAQQDDAFSGTTAAGLGSSSPMGLGGSSAATAGLGAARGLGFAPPSFTQPPTKKDPNLGTWEKHTKGIGMKLLSKMGYKGSGGLGSKRRLAERKAGISRAVEVKVRPANLGLGFGGFKEASTLKVNRQLEAQVRGQAPPEPEPSKKQKAHTADADKDDSALPTVDQIMKDSAWQKGSRTSTKKKKVSQKFIPYDQVLAKKQPENTKVIDLRGPSAPTEASLTNDSATRATTTPPNTAVGPPGLGEELLHNVSLLLSTTESKLHSHSHFASAAQQKLDSLQSEAQDLENRKTIIQERAQKMERATNILEGYQQQVETGIWESDNSDNNTATASSRFEAAVTVVRDLTEIFTVEDRKALKFDTSLTPVLLGDALENTLKRWNPLRRQNNKNTSIVESMSPVKSILELSLQGMDEASIMSLRRSLFLKYMLPRIQKAYESVHWDAMTQAEVGIDFYEALHEIVQKAFDEDSQINTEPDEGGIADTVRQRIIFETVHPKLERTLSAWKPILGEQSRIAHPPHEWILPWVPFLDHPGILPTFMSQCKRRIESAVSFLVRKIPDDNQVFLDSYLAVLRPWAMAFKTSSVHQMTTKYASSRVASLLEDGKDNQQTKIQLYEMYEDGVMSTVDFLALVEYEMLLYFVKPAYAQATSAQDAANELASLYYEWRIGVDASLGRFPLSYKNIREDEIIARCYLAVLKMITSLQERDQQSLARLEPPLLTISSYLTIQTRRIRDHKRSAQIEMLRMEATNQDKLATRTRAHFLQQNENQATFREVVEEFCLQESIPFAPRTTGAKTHVDGKQVFLFGTIPIYLDSDVIFAYEGDNRWEPTSLESLQRRVHDAS